VFVFVFRVACLAIATPLLLAEFLLGRHSRLSPPGAAGGVALKPGLSTRWNAIVLSGAWLLGVGAIRSFSRWSGWHPLGWFSAFGHKTFFDVMDFVPANVLLPAGALTTSVFMGWRISRTIVEGKPTETTPFARRWCVWALRYACPLAITAVLAAALW